MAAKSSWLTSDFKDVATGILAPHMLPAQRYYRNDPDSSVGGRVTQAMTGSNFSQWPEYLLGKKEIRHSGDVWSGMSDILSTGLGPSIDKPVWKHVGPAITGYFGGPVGGAAGGALGEKLAGGTDKEAGMGALYGAAAGGLMSYLKGAGMGVQAASGASTTATPAASSAGNLVSADATALNAADTAYTSAAESPSLWETLMNGFSQAGRNMGNEFKNNPDMIYNLMGQIGSNLVSGKPAFQGVPEAQAQSNIANRANQQRQVQQQEQLAALLTAMRTQQQGIGSLEQGLTPKGQPGGEQVVYTRDKDGRLIATVREIMPSSLLIDPSTIAGGNYGK
jgi:hypothetical protein